MKHKTQRIIILLHACLLFIQLRAKAQDFSTPFEKSNGTESSTYFQAIDFYRQLDKRYNSIDIQKAGATDVIHPLHVVYYSKDGNFDVDQWREQHKLIILINNGIHPGEPDGIDASMMLLRDAADGKIDVPDNIVLAVIPVFNIGGALNRGTSSRANQDGPKEYGFRGNAQNRDLNRDFIKMDARETQTLVQLFHNLDPDIFIDNHVSDGADYQHVMTLLSENASKQGYYTGRYLKNQFEPSIYRRMKSKNFEMVPYVHVYDGSPEKGWMQFYDPPRFASGFAALFSTFAFVPETHMLKPFKKRVDATYALMQTFIEYASAHADEIKLARKMDRLYISQQKQMVIDWKPDTTLSSKINFNGYKASYKPSSISGLPRLYYDRTKPYSKTIPFYNKFKAALTASVPKAYIIQQGWHEVIERLKMNGVKMIEITSDTTLHVTVSRIITYETSSKPYEGHYLHSKVKYTQQQEKLRLLKGDLIIPVQQVAKRYLVETLEPDAPDAFFAWGFFDGVLQQKEGFSDYVFEDQAADILARDPTLKRKLDQKRKADPDFAKDGEAQLEFIYHQSRYYEPVHMRYPVFRID